MNMAHLDSAKTQAHPGYRTDIDGLRMLAILPVVIYHAGLPFIPGGFVGVDIFFVISGFLITGIIDREMRAGTFSIVRFYERRACRILPALFTVLVATSAASFIFLLPDDFVRYATSVVATVFFVSNVFFWEQSGYFQPSADYFPLLHTWSLSVEEQFYIVIPLVMLLLASRRRRQTVVAIAAITLVSLIMSILFTERAPSAAFYLTPTRAWELGFGALLALVPVHLPPRTREISGALGLTLIAVAVFTFDKAMIFPGAAALVPTLGTVALIAAGSGGTSTISRFLSLSPFAFIGLISYSLYLWHWPVFALMRVRLASEELPTDWIVLALVASFVLAVLSWRFIEQPFRRCSSVSLSRLGVFKLTAGATAVSTVFAAMVIELNGLPDRFDEPVLVAAAAATDHNPLRARCFERMPSQGLCRFGADRGPDAPVDFILWGDSHADAIMPGVDLAARERGLVGLFAGHSACPPLVGIVRLNASTGRPSPRGHRCAEYNRALLSFLEATDSAPIVILMARWALYFEGIPAPGEITNEDDFVFAADSVDAPPSSKSAVEHNSTIMRAALADTLTRLQLTMRKIVLIGNAPEIGWNVPQKLMLKARWNDPVVPVLRSAVETRNAAATKILAEEANRDGVSFFDLVPRLCDKICRVETGGRPLYYDDDHLSTFGAHQVIGKLFLTEVWPPAATSLLIERTDAALQSAKSKTP